MDNHTNSGDDVENESYNRQPSVTARWVDFLCDMEEDWWTEKEAYEKTVFSQSAVNDYVRDMVFLDIIEVREREQKNNPGPNPREYRFRL